MAAGIGACVADPDFTLYEGGETPEPKGDAGAEIPVDPGPRADDAAAKDAAKEDGGTSDPTFTCGANATCKCDGAGQKCEGRCDQMASCGAISCGPRACTFACAEGSTCSFGCRDATSCNVECTKRSQCEIDCTDNDSCTAVRCKDGSGCLIHCGASKRCGFQECSGGTVAVMCPGGIIACNRPCPLPI